MHLSTLKDLKNAKKVKWDRPTDQPTNRQTDIVTYRVACTRLKRERMMKIFFSFNDEEEEEEGEKEDGMEMWWDEVVVKQ